MTSDTLNGPFVWNGRLATTIATAVRELADANPHRAQQELRSALAEYLRDSGCSNELADTLATIARLPRVEPS